jgi:hypothetical protein
MTLNATNLVAALVLLGTMVAPTDASARRLTLNDTGMIQCIDHHGDWTLDCAKSRQDAAYGRDVSNAAPEDGVAGFSFRKVCRSGQMAGEGTCPVDPKLGTGPDNWGCTFDAVTQFTWEVKTNDDGIHDYLRLFTNKGRKARDEPTDAAWLVDRTNTEVLCGATNWRLPDAIELQSIVYYGKGAPNSPGDSFIDPTFFPYNSSWLSWTRNDSVANSKSVWYVRFNDGNASVEHRFSTAVVRLVHETAPVATRTRATASKERFIPSDDGTEITDIMTGLVWRRCAEGLQWNNASKTCDGIETKFVWKDALDYAKANGAGGWRMPSIKELFSVVDVTKQAPAIDTIAFPGTSPGGFFSTTPINVQGNVYVKYVSFFDGYIFQQSMYGDPLSIRMVRRGRK